MEATLKPPVVEFDHRLPEHVYTAHDTYRKFRSEAPVAWSTTYGGFWVVSRYDEIMELSRNPDWFLSGSDHGGVNIPSIPSKLKPVETDMADWTRYRRVLAPLFSPKALSDMSQTAEEFADALIDQHIEKGAMDLVQDLTNPIPAIMVMKLIGLPLNDWLEFAAPVHLLNWAPLGSPEQALAAEGMERITERLKEVIAASKTTQGGALVGYLSNLDDAKPGDSFTDPKLADEEILDLLIQVILGGVDTTTALTSNALYHMDSDLATRQILRDHPDKIRFACEEFMRFYTPIQVVARTASCDFQLGTADVKKGDRLMILWASANRDEQQFESADTFMVDRFPNRHLAFGIGPHRCIGSNMARILFEVMIRKVLERLPDYRIDRERAQHYPTMSVINNWIGLPCTFTPGASGNRPVNF